MFRGNAMGNNVSAQPSFVQRDRACGVLLGAAAGEALGAANREEWGDGVARGIPVAELAALGADLRSRAIQDRVIERWDWWRRTVGGGRTASVLPAAPLVLACLDDEVELAGVVRSVVALTHVELDTSDAAVLWCTALRHAVLSGDLNIRGGLRFIETSRQRLWEKRFDEAENDLRTGYAWGVGGWAALQNAWSTIVHTPVPDDDHSNGVFRVDHLRASVQAAVRDVGSTEEAGIIGGLLGAAYGASAVPADWRLTLRGWPGIRARGLLTLANAIIGDEVPDPRQAHVVSPGLGPGRRHPHDDDLWVGAAGSLVQSPKYLPPGVDVIVSLCDVHDGLLCSGAAHLDVRLRSCGGATANLDFVLLDTVRVPERLRADGRIVFVHSMLGTNRAPAVAALYGARRRGTGIEQALRDVVDVLPDANPDDEFRAALHRLAGAA